uniref:Uncharacterized protein n=1 Tax=Utricularia reniformis TaxID=192314 RepID=A0A1Y0B2R6_9LAMI|nr:hypothetical protein AEK19_MT1472 [Utricularia reniformis]ART31663.1 hypothetical protein AEK19_MT1472 [Utricularia reniformis]
MSRVRLNWPGPSSFRSYFPVFRFRVVRRIGGIVVRFLGSFWGTHPTTTDDLLLMIIPRTI